MKCLICGKELKQIIDGEPECAAWDDAGVHEFLPGYGSRYDMTMFVIGICDDCIDKKLAEGLMTVKYGHNEYIAMCSQPLSDEQKKQLGIDQKEV